MVVDRARAQEQLTARLIREFIAADPRDRSTNGDRVKRNEVCYDRVALAPLPAADEAAP